MSKIAIRVVQDDDRNVVGMWMITIRYADGLQRGELIGIPLRNVDAATARAMLNPIRFAFWYGLDTADVAVSKAIRRTNIDWSLGQEDAEDG